MFYFALSTFMRFLLFTCSDLKKKTKQTHGGKHLHVFLHAALTVAMLTHKSKPHG